MTCIFFICSILANDFHACKSVNDRHENETMTINDPYGSSADTNVAFVEITYKGELLEF